MKSFCWHGFVDCFLHSNKKVIRPADDNIGKIIYL